MKASKYNYYVPFNDNTIIYNGVTEAFFLVPSSRLSVIRSIIENPNDLSPEFHPFLERLKKDGFLVDASVDELENVKQKFNNFSKPYQYFLMILPTYQCNLRCWYCIQEHENLFMDESTKERIKKLIERKLQEEEITEFFLTWFGGEPLMSYDIVHELTLFGKNLAESLGKSFYSSITTNGTLLNQKRIEELRDAGITSYQITIDGDPETHNKVKQLSNASAFDRTMENIDMIARHSYVTLRFNYTAENLNPKGIMDGIKGKLSEESLKNIRFLIYKVWQEDKESVPEDKVNELFNLSVSSGIETDLIKPGLCYTDRKHHDCVFPNGKVGKCDNHPPQEMSGEIMDDGSISWKEDMSDLYAVHLFDGKQPECENCKFLPTCWGPCVAKREAILREGKMIQCKYENREEEIEELIRNLIKINLFNKN